MLSKMRQGQRIFKGSYTPAPPPHTHMTINIKVHIESICYFIDHNAIVYGKYRQINKKDILCLLSKLRQAVTDEYLYRYNPAFSP